MKYNPKENNFSDISDTSSILPQVIWHITEKCQLNCKFCFASKSNLEFDLNLINSYKLIFQDLGIQKIDISGGEPLLYKNLQDIIEYLIDLKIHLTITTSGLGNDDNKNWLLSNCDLFARIIVSLDSHVSSYHNKLRGNNSVFNNAFSLINKLSSSYDNLRINSVITPFYKSETKIEGFVNLLVGLNIKEWCLIQPSKANEKASFQDYKINDEEFDEVFNIFKYYLNKQKSNIKLIKRYANNYSGYWILYPNNQVIKHNELDPLKDIKVEFNKCNTNNIIKAIQNNTLWLPVN